MSKRTTQPGSSKVQAWLIAASAGVIFSHGLFSSLTLQFTNCAQLGRIVDLIIITLVIAWIGLTPLSSLKQRLSESFSKSRTLKTYFYFVTAYSVWILIRGATSGASLRETLLALLLDTMLFWSFGLLVASQSIASATARDAIRYSIYVIAGLSLAALTLYAAGLSDTVDTWLGYGQCGGETVLRTGGVSGWLRSRGFVRNPNELGAILIMPLVFSAYALLAREKNTFRHLLASLVIGLLMMLSFSRSAWLGALSALLALVLIYPRLLKTNRLLFATLAVLGILSLAVLVVSNNSFVNEVILHKSSASNSTSQHFSYKLGGLQHLGSHPLGTGPGSAGAVGAALQDGPYINTESAYLDIAAQYGWVGLSLVIGLLGATAAILKSRPGSRVALAGLIGLLVGGLFIPIFSNLPVTMLAGLLTALSFIAAGQVKDDGTKNSR